MNWLITALLLSIPLGQLSRMEIYPGVVIYLQDLIIPGLWLWLLIERKKGSKLPDFKLIKPIIIFFLISFVSLIFGSTRLNWKEAFIGGLYLFRWLSYSGIYFFIKYQKKKTAYLNIFNRSYSLNEALLISGLSFAFWGLMQYFLLPDVRELKWLGWDDHYHRLVGTLLDPGFTGIILVLIILLAIETMQTISLKIASIIIAMIALLLTYSRASYLAFLVSILTLLSQEKRYKLGIIISVLFFLILFVLPRTEGEGTNLTRLYSLNQRIETWRQALQIAIKHPVLGIGMNLMRYSKRDLGFENEDWSTSHSASGIENSYLFVLATTGSMGLMAYLWLLYSMFTLPVEKKGQKGKTTKRLLTISLVAVSVHAIFTNTWFYPWVMIWMWYLLAICEKSHSS